MKLTKQRLREIIKEELAIANLPEAKYEKGSPEYAAALGRFQQVFGGSQKAPPKQTREPWDGIEENAERLDILSNQIGQLAKALGVDL